VHHAAIRAWIAADGSRGWATCPVTESGFVRVSSNRKVLPSAIGVEAARAVLAALRAAAGHRFLTDDVSPCDADVPTIHGHRQVTDAPCSRSLAGTVSAWSRSTRRSSRSPTDATSNC